MMNVPMKNLPPLALEYAKFLCKQYGGSSEVLLTAYCHYANYVLGLPCEDEAYAIDPQGKEWFDKNQVIP